MTTSSYQSKITRLEKAIADLRKKDAQEAKKEAEYNAKVNKATSAAAKSKSASTISSKLREADTARKNAAASASKRAGYAKDIAQKNTELLKARAALSKEEGKQRSKVAKDIERQQASQLRRQKDLEDRVVNGMVAKMVPGGRTNETPLEQYDVFISHAWEDKDDFVRELAAKAIAADLKVFYDEKTLKWGDTLRRRIEAGLANSRFAVVVLSAAFFKKEWPQRELDGLFNLEIEGKSLILPIWHKISKDEVIKNAPSLSGKLALNTASLSVDEIVERLVEIVRN
ncbi:conserved hypothetical protein (plasmid) [Sinorhizobium fredii HH103]|uniref:TIR domain-containing protein n=1 Tax=Sinorhizobium fredii (strain HH103) TaxID=1117943 RepID=G9AHK2_SINF1|nr:toll/interleukin-1 receptor domain-containing protein [Sinorhizobium fredii]CCF00534.1 conserved hypothetical protein [Sinorhizobium fredii HH103]